MMGLKNKYKKQLQSSRGVYCSIDEAFSGLQKGLNQVIVGSVVDNETFLDNVQKRRSLFEKLAAVMRSMHGK
jgi:hypothetical protein